MRGFLASCLHWYRNELFTLRYWWSHQQNHRLAIWFIENPPILESSQSWSMACMILLILNTSSGLLFSQKFPICLICKRIFLSPCITKRYCISEHFQFLCKYLKQMKTKQVYCPLQNVTEKYLQQKRQTFYGQFPVTVRQIYCFNGLFSLT